MAKMKTVTMSYDTKRSANFQTCGLGAIIEFEVEEGEDFESISIDFMKTVQKDVDAKAEKLIARYRDK